ncbi:hypothetical protein HC891_01870 [Candidatus Gracilibacteria bacterium]|nr:hypothetical protein [Candidatus Gracilibacteria bacterium]
MLVHTRQRRRDFATPPNLLVVAVLLEYRAAVLQLLWDDQLVARADMLRHPLNAIVERCERELAFPQFAGLRTMAEQIVEREGVDDLVQGVQERAIAGGNSGYDDLIDWRERLRSLPLLRRETNTTAAPALGADPQHDNYLYQLWLFYELADLLHERGCLDEEGRTTEPMRLRFRWHGCVYEVRHDQAVPLPVASWKAQPNQNYHVPGVRPDFYLWRIMPPGGAGARWCQARLAGAGRRLGCQVLPGEGQFQRAILADQTHDRRPQSAGRTLRCAVVRFPTEQTRRRTLRPFAQLWTGSALDSRSNCCSEVAPASLARIKQCSPRCTYGAAHGYARAAGVARVPRCHGIFLDALSAADATPLADRWAQSLNDDASNLLICPKPHIGPWRIDLVSRRTHCCNDARLCHIINQPDAQKPVRPPRDINDLLNELEHVLGDEQGRPFDEQAVSAVAERVQQLTRRFADFVGVDFEFYYNRLRDLGMADTLDMLGPVERESLALSEFLKDQLDRIKAHDFSASAIHISSVMEVEIKRRVFACPGLVGDLANPKRHTLGVLPFLRRSDDLDGNWARIQAYVAANWHEHPDPDEPGRVVRFDDLIARAVTRISQLRNTAAHTDPLSRRDYTELQSLIFQGGRLGYGALNALLRCWRST